MDEGVWIFSDQEDKVGNGFMTSRWQNWSLKYLLRSRNLVTERLITWFKKTSLKG